MQRNRTFRLLATRTLMVAALLLALQVAAVAQTAVGTVTIADTDEALADVMVSDGVTIVRTGDDGSYALPLDEDARFVMVVSPPEAEPSRDYYQRLPEEWPEQITINFSLPAALREPDEPFSFTKVTDSHGSSLDGAMRRAEPIFTSVNALPERPAFMIETGDISCHTGDAQIPTQTYGTHLEIPYLPVTGNHDAARSRDYPFVGHEFEEAFGPWYFAFYCGNYLFVGLPWSNRAGTLDECAEWLEQLLEMNAENEGAWVMPYFHYWDGFGSFDSDQAIRFVDLFRRFDTRAVFIGHWHMSRVHEAYGIPNYMSRTPGMGNRDLAPGGYLLVTAYPDGQLDADFRIAGYEQYVSIATPAEGGELPRSSQPVAINAYDTTYRVQSVSASAFDTDNGDLLQEIELDGPGGWTWIGQIAPEDNWPGEVRMVVNVVDEIGREWTEHETTLTLADAAMSEPQPNADWPMEQHDAERTGVGPDSFAPPLYPAWAHATGMTFGLNSPIVVDGVVYATVENNSEPRDPMPSVLAYDAATGEVLWTYELAGSVVRGGLAGNSDAICALADDGLVFALDPATGELLWEQTNMVPDPAWRELFNASPMLSGSTLVAGMGAALSAYDISDGQVQWETSVVREGGRRWTQDPSPALAGDDVILAWNSLHGFPLQTGEQRWEYENDFMLTFTPTVADGKVLTVTLVPGEDRFSRNRLLVAVDAETAEELWTAPLWTRQRGIYTSPVVADGTVYALDSRHLHAVDLDTGEVLWQVELADADYVTGSPALVGDHLYYVHSCGQVSAIDLTTQEIVWSHDLGARVDSSPAVSGNMLYVAARDGTLYAFAGVQ